MKKSGNLLNDYQHVTYPLPKINLGWPLYGAGLENLGQNGRPVPLPMPEIGEEQLLARVDAVGLCFSDCKLIKQGPAHPRISGRNLKEAPVIPGHEASLTVVKVGTKLKDRFRAGERYLIQADVFYQGRSMAFGYVLPGALQQFVVIGREILEGDEGCYLLPVAKNTGYAEVALSEPWACVNASYRITRRQGMKPKGTAWFIITGESGSGGYTLTGAFLPEGAPEKVIISGEKEQLLDLEQELGGTKVVVEEMGKAGEFSRRHTGSRGFDDLVFFGVPSPELLEEAATVLAPGGMLAVLGRSPVKRKIAVDIGRIHYDRHHYTGTDSGNLADAYRPFRSQLKSAGRTWLIGAGGPMGQMHTQKAVEAVDGPRLILATDLDDNRLHELKRRFAAAARRRQARLVTLNPSGMSRQVFAQTIKETTGGELFDNILVLAPASALVEESAEHLDDNGVLNIFAGLPRGTTAKLDISGVYLSGHRWTGSSGSSLSDLKQTLDETQQGLVAPNHSVAAIGGLAAAAEGLRAVQEGRFPGKIIIWPQFPSLPLIPLPELFRYLPNVAVKLSPEGFWTKQAEEELIGSQLEKDWRS